MMVKSRETNPRKPIDTRLVPCTGLRAPYPFEGSYWTISPALVFANTGARDLSSVPRARGNAVILVEWSLKSGTFERVLSVRTAERSAKKGGKDGGIVENARKGANNVR